MTNLTTQQIQTINQMEILLKGKTIQSELSSVQAIIFSSERKLGVFKPVLVSFFKKYKGGGKSIRTAQAPKQDLDNELLVKMCLTDYDLDFEFRNKWNEFANNYMQKKFPSYKTDHLFPKI